MSTVYPSATPGNLPPSHSSTVERTVVTGHGRDRIRWGPIVAGIFTTITSLVVLSLLGAAIGASVVDRDDRPSNFAIGAGIWGILSALIAFFIGGWMAAWGGRETGEENGVTQGIMVWMVAIPLSLYLAAVGAGAATRAIGSAAQIGSNVVNAAAQDEEMRDDVRDATEGATTQPIGTELREQANQFRNSMTGEDIENAAENTAKTAWSMLAAVMLGLAAAALGGFVGGDHHKDHFGTGRHVRD